MSWTILHTCGLLILAAASGCATGTEPTPIRDESAPFQTSALRYIFADDGTLWVADIPLTYLNTRSSAVRIDYCGTAVERREGGTWKSVLSYPCPTASGATTDSIAPGAQVPFVYSIRSAHAPNTYPRIPSPLAGVYRIVFVIRERRMPSPDLIVWEAVPSIDARRSNEFALALPP